MSVQDDVRTGRSSISRLEDLVAKVRKIRANDNRPNNSPCDDGRVGY